MTGGFEGPDTAPTAALPAVVARVTALADRLDVPHAEVFDVGRLSVASGVPEPVVKALLGGRNAGEPDVQARFLQRLDLLRRTRLKPNGRKYTQQEIADGAGMSRQQAGALINGDRRPTMEHCDAIQRFFRVHAGFLTAEDPEALTSALQHTEQELLQKLADRERGWRRWPTTRWSGCSRTTGCAASPGGPRSCPPTSTATRSRSGWTCSWRASSGPSRERGEPWASVGRCAACAASWSRN